MNNGDSVQLTCHVSKGDRPLTITWSFHGEELSSHLGIETAKWGDRSSILTITSAMAAHSGNYTCTASNQAGTTNYTTSIHVNGTYSNFYNLPIRIISICCNILITFILQRYQLKHPYFILCLLIRYYFYFIFHQQSTN